MKLISKSMTNESVCPEDWKKRKKEQKKIIKNYRPASLFPIFGKVFERLVFSTLFNSFLQNKLFTTISLA